MFVLFRIVLFIFLFFPVCVHASGKYYGTVNGKFKPLAKYACMHLRMTDEQESSDLDFPEMGFVIRKFPSDTAPIVAGVSDIALGADLTSETKNGYVSVIAIPWPVTFEPYVKGWMKRSLMRTYDEYKVEENINYESYCKIGLVYGKPSDAHGSVYLSFNFYYLKAEQHRPH